MALGLKYLHAIEAAGGLPVVVPPLREECIEPLLDRVTAVCLSGGPDLDPISYGRRRHPLTGPTERRLDVFELALAKAADARGLPLLAICRGMQVLNVARGGHCTSCRTSWVSASSTASISPHPWSRIGSGSSLGAPSAAS